MDLKQKISTFILLLALCGCSPVGGPGAAQDIEKQAAEEATAIIQNARATANALAQNPSIPQSVQPTGAPTNVIEALTPTSTGAQPAGTPDETEQSDQKIALVSVGLAAEGGFVIVYFTAPPKLANKLLIPGTVSVINEKTGFTYNQIPNIEEIGPLISIPRVNGRKGYIMLTIPAQAPLKKGDLVTVILSNLTQRHVVVQ